ncbi:MAG: histidine phosphatase family protein [Bacteroidetes bacterium]|nr:MAG: histidine phosphatase family protein [Bacteroidota bacterium]
MNCNEKTIYLIRHGETEFNKMHMIQGSGVDSNLNDTGREQAKAFYQAYKHIHFDKIYTSLLKRTKQSVASFISQGTPTEGLQGLNEISWGNREGKTINEADDSLYSDMMIAWKNGEMHHKLPNGESPLEVSERQKIAFKHIMNQEHEQNILICMHGRAMRIFLCLLLEKPLIYMDKFKHENLCLYVLRYRRGKFELELENDHKHLVKTEIKHKYMATSMA